VSPKEEKKKKNINNDLAVLPSPGIEETNYISTSASQNNELVTNRLNIQNR